MTLDIGEIIKIKAGKLTKNYKGYKGTFATLVYNCLMQKALPGFYEKNFIVNAVKKEETLFVKLSGKRSEDALMDIMDIVLENVSAFPAEAGEAHFSIDVK